MSDVDLVEALAGIAPGSRLAALRAERPDVVRHTAGAEAALMHPVDPGGVSPAERAAIARDVARHHADARLADHYSGLIEDGVGALTGPRWAAVAAHVAMIARAPRNATPDHIARLRQVGLSERDIVTVAQIVAFVSYQVRLIAGLRLMGGSNA